MTETDHTPITAAAFEALLRGAREASAAHYQARLTLNEVRALRLAALKDDLVFVFALAAPGSIAPALTGSATEEPRLWIDFTASVIMAPDPGTYRLINDGVDARDILFETTERGAMARAVADYLAHRQVDHARRTSGGVADVPPDAPPAAVAVPAVPPVSVPIGAVPAESRDGVQPAGEPERGAGRAPLPRQSPGLSPALAFLGGAAVAVVLFIMLKKLGYF